MAKQRAYHWLDPRGAQARLALALAVGVGAWVIVPDRLATMTRVLLAWDSAALVLMIVGWVLILRSDAHASKRHAAAYDPGRGFVWLLVLSASAFSLVAATVMLRNIKADSAPDSAFHVALCVATVVVSWLVTQTAFTLRYAHLFYRPGEAGKHEGGIEFPGEDEPDNHDFAYFAFTIAMTFQVSDTDITGRAIRRLTMRHALLSFAYNTVIVALSINVIAGQLQ